jgi:hypothetical protein
MTGMLMAGKTVADCLGQWFLCLITAGHGHTPKLLDDLEFEGATYYHPIVERKIPHKNGRGKEHPRKTYQPLFPGYLFLNGDTARSIAFESNHAYRVDEIPKGMQRQLTTELTAVEFAIKKTPDLKTGPLFEKGTLVRILYPHELAGTLGRANEEEDDGTVWINVPLLNAGFPIPVPPSCLEAASDIVPKQQKLNVCCRGCGRDTKNPSGMCDRCE